MQRILIFGGAFNPPTLAHEAIIEMALGLPQFDKVWLMPSGDRLDKQMAARDDQRLAMLDIVKRARFGNDPRLIVSDFELRLPRPTQTYQTVAALGLQYPDTRFTFLFGSDAFAAMPSWDEGERLRHQLDMLVVARGKSLAYNPAVLTIPRNVASLSSTEIRQLAAAKRSLDQFVSKEIAAYIAEQQLYRG